jgi:hypothetical protein
MYDFQIQTLHNNKLSYTNFHSLIKDKKVLVCPNFKFIDKASLRYYRYLNTLLQTTDLDDIIVIDNSDDVFFHMHIQSFNSQWISVTDNNKNYLKTLSNRTNIAVSMDTANNKCIFQQLLVNSEEMGFWYRTLSMQWEDLVLQVQNTIGAHDGISSDRGAEMLFQNLFRNEKLERQLKNVKKK